MLFSMPTELPNVAIPHVDLNPEFYYSKVWQSVAIFPEILAPFWWFGLFCVLFCWVVVPIQRLRHNVLGEDNYSSATKFWWAPGWGWLGVSGVGYSLIVAPLLSPDLGLRWAHGFFPWFGVTVFLPYSRLVQLVVAGLFLTLQGLYSYARSWIEDRHFRYEAWRWRMGTIPRSSSRRSKRVEVEEEQIDIPPPPSSRRSFITKRDFLDDDRL